MRLRSHRLRALFLAIIFISSLLLAISFSFWKSPASAQQAVPMPAISFRSEDGQQVLAPDWNRITWSNLPPIEEDGWINIPQPIQRKLGYNPSRRWQRGMTADEYIMLGDIAEGFAPQRFSLAQLESISGIPIQRLSLSSLGMMRWQTLGSLLRAIPELANMPVGQVCPIADLLVQRRFGLFTQGFKVAQAQLQPGLVESDSLTAVNLGQTIGQVVRNNPQLVNLALNKLNLERYGLNSIPGLTKTPLAKLDGWQQSVIKQVPGLNQIPFSKFSSFVNAVNAVGRADVVYGPKETGDPKVPQNQYISGGDRVGFNVPCRSGQPCPYLELANLPGIPPLPGTLYGKRWVGGVQKVKGGHGPMASLNGGWEPTGRLVYGSKFGKVVLTKVNESTGTAHFGIYLRACAKGTFFDAGCSPYFIGPIPWFPVKEKGLIIVSASKAPKLKVPKNIQDQVDRLVDQYTPDDVPQDLGGDSSLCGKGPGGVDFGSLAKAFSSIEGNYSSVGAYTNGGRGLGRYQYMTYRSDVRAVIAAKTGGQAFLAKADAGGSISGSEVSRYFPAADQDRLFKADQTRNIQQAIREGFKGTRIIERAGQIHFGGPGAPIDGGASDVHGRLSLYTYGKELANTYQKAQQAGGVKCASASVASGPTQKRIYQAASSLYGMSSRQGPEGGATACAWVVDKVLQKAGMASLGSNPNYVPSVETALKGGRGTQVSPSQAMPGDIIISKGQEHIGICMNNGCSEVLSNSTSRRAFVWKSNRTFGGAYDNSRYLSEAPVEKIYRVKR